MQGALKNFANILEINPDYRLDPVKNSPKILAFFEEIRRQTMVNRANIEMPTIVSQESSAKYVNLDSIKQASQKRMALSVFVPGSGQIMRGEKTKGWLLLGGNIALLGGFLYFNFEANRLEDEYLKASNPEDITATYDDYNQAYQNRNIALTGFLLLWLYTQIDFVYLSQPINSQNQISWYPSLDHTGSTSINLSIYF
jgi:hypothetical protein